MAKISFCKEILSKNGKRPALNERGDTTLFFTLSVVVLSLLMMLLALELHQELQLLRKRKELFLCTKEAKGELNEFMVFMGRANWGLKNSQRLAIIAIFIPGLQAIALNVQNARKFIKVAQAAALISYENSLRLLLERGCPLDPRLFITPFKLGTDYGFKRDPEGAALLKDAEWSYHFISNPYALKLDVKANDLDSIYPDLSYKSSETAAILSSLLSSR